MFSVTGTSDTVFMHGGKRAPTLIRALPEGPNIGLTTGFIKFEIECSRLRTRGVNSHETKKGYPVPEHSPPIRK